MSGTEMGDDDLKALAAEYGLERLYALDAEAVRRAWTYAQGITASTPRPEDIADEPAHAYRAGPEG